MLWTFLETVDRKRFTPHVLLLTAGALADDLREIGVGTTVIEAGRMRELGRTFGALREIRRVVRGWQPSIILNWTTKSHVYAATATLGARQRVVTLWWQHGIPRRDLMDVLAGILPARAIGCSSEVVANAQRRVAPWRPTAVVHPGIAVLDGPPTSGERRSVRAELGISDDEVVVGLVGRLHPMKGQDLFLEALGNLAGDGINVHGLIVGGDAYSLAPQYSERVRAMAAMPSLTGRVTFTGQVSDATKYFAASDIFVSASTHEPFGIVVLEAMRAGLPVVATPGGGPSEIVEAHVTGLLLDTRDSRALADAVRFLAEDPERARRMGANGRERVERQFTASAMTDRLQTLLSDLAAAGSS